MLDQTKKPKRQGWKQNPEAVQENILNAALEEFSQRGFASGSINVIADKTATSKRMIYYYFGDKEGLYRKVIDKAYQDMREGEAKLNLDVSDPVAAMRKLIKFTFEHHAEQQDFIRLVMIENIHRAKHLASKEKFAEINALAIARVNEIYNAGVTQQVFRTGLSPAQIHWQISAMCFFNVSNKATFSAAFGDDLFSHDGQQQLCRSIQNTVLAFLEYDPEQSETRGLSDKTNS
ncbi:MAG: TetR family transcriptional regulator [Oceanospirillaceae bacterium]|nr:TetR family transcriptional regulator [Oceanospirillaceae bacterium]